MLFRSGGSELDIVAPSSHILRQYHEGLIDWAEFSQLYRAELGSLNPGEVVSIIDDLVWGNDVCLLCYEAMGKQCHRHILAEWLEEGTGNVVIEYTGGDRQ